MMWNVKAQFVDRCSGIAGVVAGMTEHRIVLMGLRTLPGWRGTVIDEISLITPGGWDLARLEQHLLRWGASTVQVTSVDVDAPQAHGEAVSRTRRAHPSSGDRTWMAQAS